MTSTGYGDLQGGSDQDLWYTDQFSGTSSASPIIVGTVGCIQGVLRALGRSPMTPSAVRQLLRTTGSPQQDAPGRPRTERIGNRPDLRQIITQELNLPAGKVDVAASGILASPPHQVIINVNSPGVTINVGGTSSI